VFAKREYILDKFANRELQSTVHIISRKMLLEAAQTHGDGLDVALDVWYRIARKASWKSLADVRQVFPSADGVGRYTVFNIKGNSYRLITVIVYPKTLFIRKVLTHAEYDKGRWNK
jgi:mRNA interferase HigB